MHNSAMIHEPRGAGSGQSTRLLSPSEKIAHGGNRTRGSLPLAPWPEERLPTELPLVLLLLLLLLLVRTHPKFQVELLKSLLH